MSSNSIDLPKFWTEIESDEYTSTIAKFVGGARCTASIEQADPGDKLLVWTQAGDDSITGQMLTTHLHDEPPANTTALIEVFRPGETEMIAERFVSDDTTIEDALNQTIAELQTAGSAMPAHDPAVADNDCSPVDTDTTTNPPDGADDNSATNDNVDGNVPPDIDGSPDSDPVTDGGSNDWQQYEVTYQLELTVTPEFPRDQENPPTLQRIIDEGEQILSEAPSFDWLSLDKFDTVIPTAIRDDSGEPCTRRATVNETAGTAYYSDLSSGVIHEYRFSLVAEEGIALFDGWVQQGESYSPMPDAVPEWVRDDLSDRGYTISI